MFSRIARMRRVAVLGGLTVALLGAGTLPMLGGDDIEAAKRRPWFLNIAVKEITLEPHADAGHTTVVVEVRNIGKRKASGFRIGMSAQHQGGTVRSEEFSLPLSIPKGGGTTVEFRLGCNWIDFGAATARTDPSPVPGEPSNKTSNNVSSRSFGDECLLGTDPTPRTAGTDRGIQRRDRREGRPRNRRSPATTGGSPRIPPITASSSDGAAIGPPRRRFPTMNRPLPVAYPPARL